MSEIYTCPWMPMVVVLSLSLSGSLLFLLIRLPKPLYQNRLSRCWQYYIWLIVCMRFLLPFTPDISVTGILFQAAGSAFSQSSFIWQIKSDSDSAKSSFFKFILSGTELLDKNVSDKNLPDASLIKSYKPDADPSGSRTQNTHGQLSGSAGSYDNGAASQNDGQNTDASKNACAFVAAAWAAAALFCAIRRINAYRDFQSLIKTGIPAADPGMLDCLTTCQKQLHIQKTVKLYLHPSVTSPLTIGFLRPSIILPCEKIDPSQMYYVFLHELTHYSKRDLYYKWLAQAVVCIHWFNPFAHLLAKEINRSCELSCDEAVIKTLDAAGRKAYGNTLLSYAKTADSRRHLDTSLTLTEGASQLKERLGAIMHYKKNSKFVTAAACMLTACACICSAALGTYAAPADIRQEAADSPAQSENIQQSSADGRKKRQELTVDDIKLLAARHNALRIDDFSPYIDLSPLQQTGSLNALLEFSHNGTPMYMRISASDKDLAHASYENDLDHAVIFCADFLELDTLEQEYRYEKSYADIRSGNLGHILNGCAEMDDYMTVNLPDSLAQSRLKHWIGTHGGVYFTKNGQQKKHTIKNTGLFAEKPSIGGIEIRENGDIARYAKRLKKLSSKQIADVTLRRELIKTEQGIRWYAAYTELEDSQISYCLYLNAKSFTEKEFMKISESIRLKDHSIY